MNVNGFNSFCDFYSKIHEYLLNERFVSDLKFYSFLWSETPNDFVLSIKSIDSSFDPSFIYKLLEYLPYTKDNILVISDNHPVLVLTFYRN